MPKLKLKQIRKRRHQTQAAFAKMLGISQNYLSEIESGKKNPSMSKLEHFADVLESSVKSLIVDSK